MASSAELGEANGAQLYQPMTNLNREPIGPFPAPARGWDGLEPEAPSLPDLLMEDDPGIYQDLLTERDEAMQRYERLRAENERLRVALLKIEEVVTRPSLTDRRALAEVLILAGEALGSANLDHESPSP